MREIKFRAWEKETEMGKAGSMSYNQDFCYCQIRTNDGVEIMQYTGLKDKNGKEIYEGDIISFVGGNSIITFDEISDIRVVEILEDTKQLGWKGSGYTFCEANCEKLVEIIGNIYENLELLNYLNS